jgi:hypothetical protein
MDLGRWYHNFKFWGVVPPQKEPEPEQKETKVIDVMEDDVDPAEVTLENAYKTRWIWYHTILAIEILMTNLLLIAILIVIAVKL